VHALVSSMADSGLPCYHFANTLDKLDDRFKPQMNDIRAAKWMRQLVFDANQKVTTTIYDGIQKLQNNIHSDTWR
jgi:phosphatidylinositol 4-kinase A